MKLLYGRKPTDVTGPESEIDSPDLLEDVMYYGVLKQYAGRMMPMQEYALRHGDIRQSYEAALDAAMGMDGASSGRIGRLQRVVI